MFSKGEDACSLNLLLFAFACIGLEQHYERKLPQSLSRTRGILVWKLLAEERLEDDPGRLFRVMNSGMTPAGNINPKVVCSLVLNTEQEAMTVASHKHTFLPLDDCLYAL